MDFASYLTLGLQGAALIALLLLWYVLYELISILRLQRKLLMRVDTMMDMSKWWTIIKGFSIPGVSKFFSQKKSDCRDK